jgi:hypothetical protein
MKFDLPCGRRNVSFIPFIPTRRKSSVDFFIDTVDTYGLATLIFILPLVKPLCACATMLPD